MTEIINSRAALSLSDKLRRQLNNNWVKQGSFLPSERTLARENGVGSTTVRNALKILEQESLIAVEERRGHRVLAHDPAQNKAGPLAFVLSDPGDSAENYSSFFKTMLIELQRAAGAKKSSLLSISRNDHNLADIVQNLQTTGASGVIVDGGNRDFLEGIRQTGIPMITLETWSDNAQFDAVLQDGFEAGLQAATHLVERGHKHIAWLGLPFGKGEMRHALERFSGAIGGLAQAGLEIPAHFRIASPEKNPDQEFRMARELLSRPDRPTAVMALWQGPSKAVIKAAADLGLELGKDLDMVGWSTEEEYETDYVLSFGSAPVQPAIVWSVRTMADVCISRLFQRQAEPLSPITKTRIPTRLKLPKKKT